MGWGLPCNDVKLSNRVQESIAGRVQVEDVVDWGMREPGCGMWYYLNPFTGSGKL